MLLNQIFLITNAFWTLNLSHFWKTTKYEPLIEPSDLLLFDKDKKDSINPQGKHI